MMNILSGQEGNDLIMDYIKNGKSFGLSRIGIGEIKIIHNKINNCLSYHDLASIQAGGVREDSYEFFFDEYINALKNSDINAYWVGIESHEQNVLLNSVSPNSIKVMHRAVEPYYFDNPWSNALLNKKVLIINPFTDSIQIQYPHLNKIWGDKNIMPNFELLTIKSKFLFDNNSPSWKDVLNDMKQQISEMDFDIALLGCSLYGLPLVSYIKDMGKSAIYVGGALQLLFGIKGKRWDSHDEISKMYNDYWVRPLNSEIPSNYVGLDGGTYW
jgi:hypothetical protein